MIEFDGKKFLNEQEAYLYCMENIKKIYQILGSAAPEPIAGPTGPQGATGPQGVTGPRGKGFYGVTAELPSATAYEEGDFFLLFNGNVYKKVGSSWVLQYNLKGPQGPVGLEGGTDVVANPVDAYTDTLEKIKIDGTTYNILPSEQRTYLDALFNSNSPLVEINGASINIPNNFSVEGSTLLEGLRCTNVAVFDDEVRVGSIDDIVDKVANEPIIICENLNDANGNARFVEGDITVTAQTGLSIDYAKWILSGSHLLIVVAGDVTAGETPTLSLNTTINLPQYIMDKIFTLGTGDNVAYSTIYVYNNSTTLFETQIGTLIKLADKLNVFHQNALDGKVAGISFRVQFDLAIDME